MHRAPSDCSRQSCPASAALGPDSGFQVRKPALTSKYIYDDTAATTTINTAATTTINTAATTYHQYYGMYYYYY